MKDRNVALAILFANVAAAILLVIAMILSAIVMSGWIVEGPRRFIRNLLRHKDNGMMRTVGNGRKNG